MSGKFVISAALGCSVLLAAALAHDPKVVMPGEGKPVAVPFHPTTLLLSENENEGGLSFFEFRVPPKTPAAPPHIHEAEDEFFYVVSGEMSFLDRDKVVVGGPGTFLALTRNNLHAFWNHSDEETVMLVAASKGNFEKFFDEVAMAVQAEKPASAEAMGALIGKTAAARGITIRMDAVPDEAKALYFAQ
jgi:mannose-6-phosphate isomerase-like protein (cupin superfamily)